MGNTSDWETLLLADVPAWLERALPDGWTAEVAEAPSDRILDGLLTLRGPSGTDAIFALEAKRWTTGPTSAVVGVLAHLQRQSRYPIVLVTDHTNPPLRAACDELGMGYVDKNGWVSLRSTEPVVLIRLAGVDRRPPFGERSTAVVRLTGPSTGLIIERLLDTPAQKALGVRQLAKASGVTPGAVAKVLPALVKAGAVERDTDGRVTLVRKRLLLATWTADYQFEKTNSDITYGLQPRGMVDLVGRLTSLDTGYAVTGALAATATFPRMSFPWRRRRAPCSMPAIPQPCGRVWAARRSTGRSPTLSSSARRTFVSYSERCVLVTDFRRWDSAAFLPTS